MSARILFTLFALAIGLKLLSLGFVEKSSTQHWKKGNVETAGERLELLRRGNVIEPWIATFNSGVVEFTSGEYRKSEQYFRDALKHAPKDRACDVRKNLGISIEAQGDAALKDNDPSRASALFEKAIAEYEKDESCDLDTSRTEEKLSKSQGEEKDADGEEGSDDEESDEGSDSGDEPPTKSDEQQLQDQMQKAQADRQRAERNSQSREYDATDQSVEKGW